MPFGKCSIAITEILGHDDPHGAKKIASVYLEMVA